MNVNALDLEKLRLENAELRARLEEAEDTLTAIRSGDVDALIVGNDLYTLDSANAANNKLRKDVLAQMEDAVLAVDNHDHIIFMNPAAEKQYGKNASNTLGRSRFEVYEERWPNALEETRAQQELEKMGAYRAHSIHIRNDHRAIHVESTVSRLRDAQGNAIGYLSVIRDISERVQAEDTLRIATLALAQRERQFSTLVENSPDIFARLDRDFRHLYASPITEKYSGLKSSDHLGKTNAELGMPEELCATWNAALRTVFETGVVASIKFKFTTITHEERIFNARLIPEFAEDGTVESVLSIASDITEQELVDAALRESQARLQFTLDAAKVGDWELDVATDIARHSLRHDRCFGYMEPVHPWGGQIMLSHIHPEDRTRIADELRRSIQSLEDLHFECRVIWPDSSVHWIEVHGSVYGSHGKPLRILGLVVDSTTRKLAEEALRDADRRKDEFLATLAHELRNPLAPIRNALQIMQLTQDVAIHENARGIIDRQLKQMVHIVDDLLDVGRISQGKIELRRQYVDVATIIQAAIETSRPIIDGAKHNLTVRLPAPQTLMVNGDITRLCQSISNLLNNAAKYTPTGGRIEVTAERDHEYALIAVQDSGVGIRTEMLPRVFDMFAQVDRSLERSQGGLGIGLALVRKLVEMHGGSVEAHSDGQGLGCKFLVRIPLVTAVTPSHLSMSSMIFSGPATGIRVLIVDDNLDNSESLAQILNTLGYQTLTAKDGIEAIHVASNHLPRIIILDIGLPEMNGLDVAKHIREQPWGKEILLIAISGWGQEHDRNKSKEAGMDHHFVKPVDLQALTHVLGQFPSL